MHYKKVLIDLKQFWLKPIPNNKINPRPKDRGNFYPYDPRPKDRGNFYPYDPRPKDRGNFYSYKTTHDLKIVAIFTHTKRHRTNK